MALPLTTSLPDCPTCHGRRHVKQPGGGWARCACTRAVITQHYIRPALHHGETAYPTALDAQPPLPLTTSLHHGSWDAFRRMAWRSLVAYEPRGLSHDVLTLERLINIDFARETGASSGYSSLAHVDDAQLLVLIVGVDTPVHKWTGYVLSHVLTRRQHSGLPVWCFTHMVGNRLWALFRDSEPHIVENLKQTFDTRNLREWR